MGRERGPSEEKDGISVEPDKTNDLTSWPVPQRLRDMRAFVGLCSYYRKFIPRFSTITAPLFDLTKKDRPFVWSGEHQHAFEQLKEALSTAPVLTLPRDGAPYTLDCDASDIGLGAVLSQNIDREERVIAYGSRLFSTAERNYCVTRRELLVVVYFTQLYRQYLLGSTFTLRTDHAALRWLQRTQEPIGQQARWLEKLAEYDFQIVHRPGRRRGNADALSRKSCRQCGQDGQELFNRHLEEATSAEAETPGAESMVVAQRQDPVLSTVRSWMVSEEDVPTLAEILQEEEAIRIYWHQRDQLHLRDDVLFRQMIGGEEQVLVPASLRDSYIALAHTSVTGGHLGVRRTKHQIRRRAYWIGWAKDVKRYCKRCRQCCQYRSGLPPRQGPLQPIPCGEPWERVSMDITGPHPRSSQGNVYILTMMDQFTKFVEAVPIANQEATTVAKAFVETVVVRYGVPLQILTDQGRNFEGQVFSEMCRLLEIDKARTTTYHPRCNGMIERFLRTMNSMISKVVEESQRNWDTVLPCVLGAYRASCHETTGYSPNYLLFARENRAPLDLVYGLPKVPTEKSVTYADYVEELARKFREAYDLVRQNLGKAAERRKRMYDMRVRPVRFKTGDLVYCFSPRRYVGRSPKWDRHFTGPYRVVQQCGPVNYLVPRSTRAKPFRIHVDKLRLCQSDTNESVPKAVAPEEEQTRQRSGTATPQSQRTATTGRWKRSAGNDEPAAMKKPKPSSILPDLLPVREFPKERERILGRDQHLQEAARKRRTTPSDPRPLMKRCRQRGTNDHDGPSDAPPGSATNRRWRKD